MKKNIWFLSLLALTTFACNQGKIDKLSQSNQQLQSEVQLQDSLLNDFMTTFNEFEANLDAIKQKEEMIALGSGGSEMRKPGKEAIMDDLQSIDELMERNRLLIEDLTQRLASSEGDRDQFRRMVNRLNKQLKEKDGEIGGLKEELVAVNYEIELLNRKTDTLRQANSQLSEIRMAQMNRLSAQREELDGLSEELSDQEKEMRTKYVYAATSKELKARNIMTKEGGLFGIGATKKLSSDFDTSLFQAIDMQETHRIPVSSKKASLLTRHPEGSYLFNEDGKQLESLEITDPERFWEHSNYLVVVLN